MEQAGLSDFEGGEEHRPSAEAAAVAGGSDQAPSAVVDPDTTGYPDPQGSVELAVMQVDYSIERSGGTETPIIHVFGRTAENELEHVRVQDFRPYFYIPDRQVSDDLLEDDRLTDIEPGFESIKGESLTRVYGRTPRDVGAIRDRFYHFEADILFPNRFLIDKGIKSGVAVPARRTDDGTIVVPHQEVQAVDIEANPRVNTFDIEVNDRQGFPEDGEEPILCLTSHDSYDDEFIAWLYDAPGSDVDAPAELPDYEPYREDTTIDVRVFGTEEKMLDAFLTYLEETDPDILTGWNFDDFDAPYFLDRLEECSGPHHDYDLRIERLSRIGEVWRSDWGGPDIKGRVVFDLLYAYQRTQFSELDSYRLDAVGETELGVGKERYAGSIGDLWEQDPERLLEYNVRDVELCVEIDRKQEVISFWDEVRTFVGCKLEDATTPGDAVDMYVLHKAHGNFVLPSKGGSEAEEYEGGAVFEPISGVKENVTVLDLKSLYPMCMATVNISPETRVTEDPEEVDMDTVNRAPNGTLYRKEPDGIIREMINELLGERDHKKELRNTFTPDSEDYDRFDRQQAAVKVIMNSLYGVLGWVRFRLYDKAMGAAITATGREVIKFTEQAANDLGYEVIYGDSVTGDRPIVVRDSDGQVRIRPIQELFERAKLSAEAEVLITADGGPVASAVPGKSRRTLDGWDALSLSEKGDPEWQPIEQVIRHETDKPTVTLRHKFGESTTTRDHSYVVEEGGEYVETTPENVDEPLRIPGVPAVGRIEEIDIYEVLHGYERRYEDGRGTGGTTAKTKRIHADDEYVWFGHEHHGDLDSIVKVKRFIDLKSADGHALIRLLGAYVTEGSASTIETTDSKFGASIAESRIDWLEQLRDDYYRLFENTDACVIASDSCESRTVDYDIASGKKSATYSDGTCKIQMMNELAAIFFREFGGQTSRGKRVPWFVYHLPDAGQNLFLDMVIEGDGSRIFPRYTDEYAERHFDFETVSRELAAGISLLLTQRGQKHSLKFRDSKGSYTIRTCDYYRKGRDPVLTESDHDGYVYDLSVAENGNFVDAVGGIVLHNTDSVMLELGPGVEKKAAIDQAFDIEKHINAAYDEFAREELGTEDHRFQIEFEKLYRRFFQAGKKKRYAGYIIWKEGKDVDDIDITGFEYKRSDIAPITKRVQKQVIEMIVTGEDLDDVKEYVREVTEDFAEGNVDYEDIAIPGGIGKQLDNYDTDTAHVRGAKYANLLLGTNFQRGSKPKRLYLERVQPSYFERFKAEHPELFPNGDGMGRDGSLSYEARKKRDLFDEFRAKPDVICFEYTDQIPEEFDVDWEKMLEKTLKGPIARVLEALDISWEEIRSGQEQTGLGSFM